jgi:hypothetical protein
MSETGLFIIGAIVFAITVYGSVMAAGIALSRRVDEAAPTPQAGA